MISTGKPEVVVPDILGDPRSQARAELEELGLEVRMREEESDEERDIVVNSDPRPATTVSVGTVITLFYSDGPEEVPNVIGMEEGRATRTLERAGFDVSVTYDTETRAERGTVLEQSPEPLSEEPSGTTVVITVSDYEEPEEEPAPTPTEEPDETPPAPTETPSDTEPPLPDDDQGGGGQSGN